MNDMNYHHLRYFSAIAGDGSIAKAARRLSVSQPTLSAQLRELERAIGEPLFDRVGRGLVLTEMGRLVARYSEEIFRIGDELVDTIRGHAVQGSTRFTIGVADSLPKLSTYRLLRPALALKDLTRIVLHIDKPDRLLADLSIHAVDLVLLDQPAPPSLKVRAFSHQLGDSGVTVFGVADLARRHRRGFPGSLDGAPFVLPTEGTPLRRSLDRWFTTQHMAPRIVAEVEDLAMLQVFGQHGLGLFAAPTVVERAVTRQHGVHVVGRIDAVRQQFYAVTVERRLRHPAALAISREAFR